jgi:hypothetical protein
MGDTFQVRMRAVNSVGNEIRDARPTWASLEPRVVSIDPLSGWARGVAPGAAKVVAQVGDITDTVDVNVVAPAGMNIAPIVAAGETADTAATRPGRAELNIYALPTQVGDTTPLTILPRAANGTTAEPSAVTLRISGDTTVAQLTSDRRLVGLKEGQIHIVGSFADITDSAAVTIRARGTLARADGAARAFRRPSYDTAAALARNRTQVDSALNAILSSSVIRTSSGRHITGQVLVAQAAHAARLSDDYVERRTGLLFGGRLVLAPFRRLQVSANIRSGSLTADNSSPAEDMQLTEAEGQLTFMPVGWFSLQAGATMRAQSTDIAVQRWQYASGTVLFHPRLIGDRFRTVMGFTLIPYGQLFETSTVTKQFEPTSMAGDAGLEFQAGFFNAAILYHSERISFPIENASQRVDRFSMIRLRLGLQLGR